ncbi:hypothetical protein O181_074248 [Austropuccinia psidii MF-1]|uniref:Integrase catalytic domain-containing protein n=1 Tax=Austropuccinia psidii MF-1 TaxID=1389203 RepID=A0A9Q3IAT2_9BASI|nr:hypothetical protein [Austropuccinia psidii MF-1]
MYSSKVQQILNWPQPKNIKDLQSLLVFANFYHCFFKNYSKKITSLTSLLKKYSPFIFNEEACSQFQILKEAFTTAPILSHFNPSLPTILETDASDYALGAVLSQFHFTITYRPGRLATLPDALSRQDDVYPERGVEFISKNPQNFHQVIEQDGIQESRLFSIKVEIFSDLVDMIQKDVWQDKDYKEILKQLARGESVTDYSLEPQAKSLLFKNRLEKTLKLIKRDFYWAGMNQFIKDYVSSCQKCSRNKNIHHKKLGFSSLFKFYLVLGALYQWTLSLNCPCQNSFDSILVVVDRFSKMAIFIPTYVTITALELAQIFISNVFSKHGLPVRIVSYRGSLFVSSFWTNLCQQLKISRDLSAPFHPETDGQTEKVNKILAQYLRIYVSYHQDDWHTWLPLSEFAYNNAEHSSTKKSPFFTIYGRNPSFDSTHISQDSPAGKLSTKLQSVQKVVKEELESAIRRFKTYAHRNRPIPPDFQPGDKV